MRIVYCSYISEGTAFLLLLFCKAVKEEGRNVGTMYNSHTVQSVFLVLQLLFMELSAPNEG